MYEEEDLRAQYLSEQIEDCNNESSYIRINKKYLEGLEQVNQIEDLAQYRKSSQIQRSEQSSSQSDLSSRQVEENTRNCRPVELPHKNCHAAKKQSKWSNIGGIMLEESFESQQAPSEQCSVYSPFDKIKKQAFNCNYQTELKILPQSLYRESNYKQKEKNVSLFSNLQSPTNKQQVQSSGAIHITQNVINRRSEVQKDEEISHIRPPSFQSPNKNRLSNKENPNDFSRLNYKKMLESQIYKNKELSYKIHRLESQLSSLTIDHQNVQKNFSKVEKQLSTSEKIRKENKARIRDLDGKLESLKLICKSEYVSKSAKNLIEEMRCENRALKEENEKYKAFAKTVSQSIFLLKGKRPDSIEGIWDCWKQIFEQASRGKWNNKKKNDKNADKKQTKTKLQTSKSQTHLFS